MNKILLLAGLLLLAGHIGCSGASGLTATSKTEQPATKKEGAMKTLKIVWQRLISDGQTCPRCGSTEAELDWALASLKKSLAPLDIQVVLEKKEISESAFKKDPLKSNQIWLNDRLLEDWLGGQTSQSQCCDVCGDSDCRTVGLGGQVYETIPADLIVKAGLMASAQLLQTGTIDAKCGCSDQKKPGSNCCPK